MYRFLAVLVSVILLGGCLTTSSSGRVVVRDGDTRVAISFNEHDRRLIHDYYRKHRKRLPPGLAKRGGKLPPGLAKRQRLPPGLGGKRLPADLLGRLRVIPKNYIRLRVGTDVVLMNRDTRIIVDVISVLD